MKNLQKRWNNIRDGINDGYRRFLRKHQIDLEPLGTEFIRLGGSQEMAQLEDEIDRLMDEKFALKSDLKREKFERKEAEKRFEQETHQMKKQFEDEIKRLKDEKLTLESQLGI